MELKVRKVGNSLGVILPKEVISRLRVGAGDSLSLTEAAGSYRISAYDPDVARQVDAGKKAMRRYRNALRELAK
jgi:putative addiction module antidote